MSDIENIRNAILSSSLEASSFGDTPDAGELYVPLSHIKALKLSSHIVVGGRGVGKSFWTAVLRSTSLRSTMQEFVPEFNGLQISVGFSNVESINDYPNEDTFELLLNGGFEPYDIWRAVIMRWIAKKTALTIPSVSWGDTVNWLKSYPEAAAGLMGNPRNWKGLIIFDALDRTSNDWQRMDEIVRGLLRAILWLKSYKDLYAKVFLREDQAARTVFNFPDASKILATRAELTWSRHDLHGLLWQRLINAPAQSGELFRGICKSVAGQKINDRNGIYQLPDEMKRESDSQRKAFERLAGPWMGKDKRRGVPYTWSVNHLSDGRGQTSPRSFLAAISQAVNDSYSRYPQHDYALHYESLKRGIQKASEIRVTEVAEDYPWVPDVLSTLKGLNVPSEYDLVEQRWISLYPNGPQSVNSNRLPAQHAERGWSGIREDLENLGLIETKKDGRIDMPDLYRVGFGLGRKGGVKPRSNKD
ncbi:hypothetical protein [Pectobacterium polaris]|uniref:hypothetical protein n=1 Tax=Pectobacterium polaris TaxID=2042057 RepID=UPI000EA36617|nr:hypothetical protein [Pectobacterium polaris]RJL21388.1 hypothetical protein D5074_14755 [Pectobacterium polaris]